VSVLVAPLTVHLIAGTVQLALIAVSPFEVTKYPAQFVEVAVDPRALLVAVSISKETKERRRSF
jgi:uncharacterized membrane protein